MQYPVPQFTEVEDKIIGPLTLRQFLIILAGGGLVFLVYSGSKDLVITSFSGVIVGIPALMLAFAPFNGRPMYRSIPIFASYLTSAKILVFRKDSNGTGKVKAVQVVESKPLGKLDEDDHTRLRKIQYQLEQRASQEAELLGNSKSQISNDK